MSGYPTSPLWGSGAGAVSKDSKPHWARESYLRPNCSANLPPHFQLSKRQSSPPPDARLRHLAERLHALGARGTYEYLREVAGGADPWVRLEKHAAVSARLGDFIRANDGPRLGGSRSLDRGRR